MLPLHHTVTRVTQHLDDDEVTTETENSDSEDDSDTDSEYGDL